MHLAAGSQLCCPTSELFTLAATPEAVLKDHIEAEYQDVCSQIPESSLDRIPCRVECLA